MRKNADGGMEERGAGHEGEGAQGTIIAPSWSKRAKSRLRRRPPPAQLCVRPQQGLGCQGLRQPAGPERPR